MLSEADPDILEDNAAAALESGNLDDAEAIYATLCEADPDNAHAWMMRGAIKLHRQELRAARDLLQHALEVKKDLPESHYYLALVCNSQGEIDQAVGHLQTAITYRPDYSDALETLGALLGRLGRFEEAEQASRLAIHTNSRLIQARVNRASALANLGRIDEAISQLYTATELDGHDVTIRLQLARMLETNNRPEEAVQHYEGALAANPRAAEIHYSLANLHLRLGRWNDAYEQYARALQLNPDIAEAYMGLSTLLLIHKQSSRAIDVLHKGIARIPQTSAHSAQLHFILASAYQQRGDWDTALGHYRKTVKLDPGHEEAEAQIGQILAQRGDYDTAFSILAPLLETDNGSLPAAIAMAPFASRVEKTDECINTLEIALSQQTLAQDTDMRSKALFALAHLYDKVKNYERAFTNAEEANRLYPLKFDKEANTAYVRRLKEVFNDFSAISRLTNPRAERPIPVFIVGMPRSGTSLAEQILASHPRVAGRGEWCNLNGIASELANKSKMQFPECMTNVQEAQLTEVAEGYIESLRQSVDQPTHVTNKTPSNFLHLGLIEAIFPNAVILHCVRDPIDTCLSCYFTNFSGNYPYTYDLDNLGYYYREYQDLMAFWKSQLTIPILDVAYENLVFDLESTGRQMLEFTGLEWDPKCMTFFETERSVMTASFDQVRSPIYQRSVGRWKNYEPHVGHLRDILIEGA